MRQDRWRSGAQRRTSASYSGEWLSAMTAQSFRRERRMKAEKKWCTSTIDIPRVQLTHLLQLAWWALVLISPARATAPSSSSSGSRPALPSSSFPAMLASPSSLSPRRGVAALALILIFGCASLALVLISVAGRGRPRPHLRPTSSSSSSPACPRPHLRLALSSSSSAARWYSCQPLLIPSCCVKPSTHP